LQDDVLGLKGRVLNGSENIFSFEKRIVGENLFETRASTQQVQNIRDPDAQAANAWTAPAFARLDGNPLKQFRVGHLSYTLPQTSGPGK
jgi:hypothetical protein